MTSQPRSLLSIARLNIAKSRMRPSIWSLVRTDQTCLGRSGGFGPISLPLFQGARRSVSALAFFMAIHGHSPQLVRMTRMGCLAFVTGSESPLQAQTCRANPIGIGAQVAV